MWFLRLLLESWRERLAAAHVMAAEPLGTPWLWRVRTKILRYLISRYEAEAAQGTEGAMRALPDKARVTFCRVEAADCPPKSRHDLMDLFTSIRRANAQARDRLRWRWL